MKRNMTTNVEVVREICRTLVRLKQTELVSRYRIVIIGIAKTTYRNEFDADYPELIAEPVESNLSPSQIEDLSKWIKEYPWFVFSLVVGLATGDENLAWGLAYG